MSAKRQPKKRVVFYVSDSSAGLSWHSFHAVYELFSGQEVEESWWPLTRSVKAIQEVVEVAAAEENAFIVYTFADPEHQEAMHSAARRHGILSQNQSGELTEKLERWFGVPASRRPVHNDDPHEHVAQHFRLMCSDGQHPEKYKYADILLVGVSRIKKTPTADEFVRKGLKVADYPLVMDVPLPPGIGDVPNERIFVFKMRSDVLQARRHKRLDIEGLKPHQHDGKYVDIREIRKELRYTDEFIAAHPGCHPVDTTVMGTEEVAGYILKIMREHRIPLKKAAK